MESQLVRYWFAFAQLKRERKGVFYHIEWLELKKKKKENEPKRTSSWWTIVFLAKSESGTSLNGLQFRVTFFLAPIDHWKKS